MKLPIHVLFVLFTVALSVPANGLGTVERWSAEPFEQTFVLTAYYSPLPGQCCYVKGGYKADQILNGEGFQAADGTPVYPGMLAAPPTYPFGTRIDLPGLGVMTVHDRGGAIQEQGNVHRLDVWAGHGEEGLARALAFGVQRIQGTVYPLASAQPELEFALENLPAPADRLEDFLIHDTNLMVLDMEEGNRGLSVMFLQRNLKELGYFAKEATGFYGPETREALTAFLHDHGLSDDPSHLSDRAAAYMLAALRRNADIQPVSDYVDNTSAPSVVTQAQRILRHLGYYRGRTDGQYSDALFAAILSFQQAHALAGDAESPGAGRIGPLTMAALDREWNKSITQKRAERYLAYHRVDQTLAQRKQHIAAYMEEGSFGSQVELLQTRLAEKGYFPAEEVNGNFGPMTKKALIAYQLDTGLITSRYNEGAGTVGPLTLAHMRSELNAQYYSSVRGQGWNVL